MQQMLCECSVLNPAIEDCDARYQSEGNINGGEGIKCCAARFYGGSSISGLERKADKCSYIACGGVLWNGFAGGLTKGKHPEHIGGG